MVQNSISVRIATGAVGAIDAGETCGLACEASFG